MPAKRSRNGKAPVHANGAKAPRARTSNDESSSGSWMSEAFAKFAHHAARLAGKPSTFLAAVFVVVAWALSGPFFGYSDTWQLVINTSTTIVTFLMVFVIQNTQNRDGMAIQIKLAELIVSMHGPQNARAVAEDLTEEELETLHEEYKKRAETTLESLEHRRASKPGK
jgi:low affinity Fe/Cu permease